MGSLPSKDKMVSSLIVSPKVGQPFDAGTNLYLYLIHVLSLTNPLTTHVSSTIGIDNDFSVQMANVITGFFGNANSMYYLAPQLLNQGTVQGHCHVVAQKLDGNGVPDPKSFQFFKGINTAAKPGTNVCVTHLPSSLSSNLPLSIYIR